MNFEHERIDRVDVKLEGYYYQLRFLIYWFSTFVNVLFV